MGFSSVDLNLIDEASRVPDYLYEALRPMLLIRDGALWLMSTPLSKRGFFYQVGLMSGTSGNGLK